jgi:Tol biopolymer transport system component
MKRFYYKFIRKTLNILAFALFIFGDVYPTYAQPYNLIVYTGFYVQTGGVFSNLYYMNPDGSGKTQITDFYPCNAQEANVSYDGSSIAFRSNLNSYKSSYYGDIFSLDLSTSKLTRVTGSEYITYEKTGDLYVNITDDVSDGKHLQLDESDLLVAYQGCSRYYTLQEANDISAFEAPVANIWVRVVYSKYVGGMGYANVTPGGRTGVSIKLTDGNYAALQPAWSPDSTKIAGVLEYTYYDPDVYDKYGELKPNRTPTVGFDNLAVWSSDGTLLQMQAADMETMFYLQPKFSPDGTKLAFCKGTYPSMSLVVVNSDDITGEQTMIAEGKTDYSTLKQFSYSDPDWSPDGTRIALVYSTINSSSHITANIFLADSNGTGDMSQITSVPQNAAAGDPDFSPDGQWIAYTIVTSKSSTLTASDLMSSNVTANIYIQNLTTGEQIQVSDDGASGEPCWAFLYENPYISPDDIASTSSSTTTIKKDTICPFEDNIILKDDLTTLKEFRGFLLKKNKLLADMFYRHASEVASILESCPQLRQEFIDLTYENIFIAKELIKTGNATISSKSLKMNMAFLEKINDKAGIELQETLKMILRDINEGGLLRRLCINVNNTD